MLQFIIFLLSSTFALLVNATPVCRDAMILSGGDVPNTDLPTTVSEEGIREIQLAQFLENLEVSFFCAGLANITDWGANGYSNDSIEIVGKIAAQEEIHLQSLHDILQTYDASIIPPCNYSFPVGSTKDFFQLARLISAAGIGATIGLSERLAATDPMLAKLVSSILTVEARHDAFFRLIDGDVPNPAPFDTGSEGLWAYNVALSFIVPGSCPVTVPLPILPRLGVSQKTAAPWTNGTSATTLHEFTWDAAQTAFTEEAGKQLLVGWVNQANLPVYTPLNITTKGKGTASVPQGMSGIAFAAITTERYRTIKDLERGTMAGPVVVLIS